METTFNAVQLASLFIGVALPILVGLVTHNNMPAAVRPVLLALLSAVSGFATEFIGVNERGEDFNLVAALTTWLTTFVVAVATHYGFWKPTGVAELATVHFITPAESKPYGGNRKAA